MEEERGDRRGRKRGRGRAERQKGEGEGRADVGRESGTKYMYIERGRERKN